MIELSEKEKPRTPPSSSFSAPFASPTLRWASKKRLRCFQSAAVAANRLLSSPSLSPISSPDRFPCRSVPSVDGDGPRPRTRHAVTDHYAGGSPFCPSSSSSRSPPYPSRSGWILARLSSSRSKQEEGAEPSRATAADLSTRGASGETLEEDGGEGRRASDALCVGWSLRSAVRNDEAKEKKQPRKVELWVSLSRDEIEEDFLWMTGAKPPRRTRKRDRGVTDHFFISVFPGSWMPNKVTAARYRVSEPSDSRKVSRDFGCISVSIVAWFLVLCYILPYPGLFKGLDGLPGCKECWFRSQSYAFSQP